ncbi:uncharacterized protein EI90DRAFT_3289940 [Cantharellus anzutake]|uniref:uncharacterized protein n=1 Tax=Cantharellus anzutake TaxID=1750568 RepID=UPI0019057599|nr:uncharacterized protein EI90DRAFT_3292334 [Cantharellus anzutake]XP_038915273.1 uncharacterized protein EI90DRAFT_3289940 [Cantharellus anzutake]KAF8323643.1 hypothetical protein EI90DRAFT_3292334 [Cantharellus anzutake]KAF8330052.1 hypothetical protein EI90DRAFT_3289940 [Cantharellus anzutake]
MPPALVDIIESSHQFVDRLSARFSGRVSASQNRRGLTRGKRNIHPRALHRGASTLSRKTEGSDERAVTLSDPALIEDRSKALKPSVGVCAYLYCGHSPRSGASRRNLNFTAAETSTKIRPRATQKPGQGVAVSTAILASILSAVLTIALCILFYKYGLSRFKAWRNQPPKSKASEANSVDTTAKERKNSVLLIAESPRYSLPSNPFQSNPVQPRIQEGPYDDTSPEMDPVARMRPISLALKQQYQARKAEATQVNLEESGVAPSPMSISIPLFVKTHHMQQSSNSSSVTVVNQHGIPPTVFKNPSLGDFNNYSLPHIKPISKALDAPPAMTREPSQDLIKRKPVPDPERRRHHERGHSHERHGRNRSRSRSETRPISSRPGTPSLSKRTRRPLAATQDDSSESGQELSIPDFRYDVPNTPRYSSLPRNQYRQSSQPNRTAESDKTPPFFPPTPPSVAEYLANFEARSKQDRATDLPLPRLVKVVGTFPPSLPDEMEVTLNETLRLIRVFADDWCYVRRLYPSKPGDENEKQAMQVGAVPLLCLAELDGTRVTRPAAVTPVNVTKVDASAQPGTQETNNTSPDSSESQHTDSGSGSSKANPRSGWSTDMTPSTPMTSPDLGITSPESKGNTLTKQPSGNQHAQIPRSLPQPPVPAVRQIADTVHSRNGSSVDKIRLS